MNQHDIDLFMLRSQYDPRSVAWILRAARDAKKSTAKKEAAPVVSQALYAHRELVDDSGGGGDRLMDVKEVAKRLGLTLPRTRALIKAGTLKHIRIGKYVKVRRSTVDRFIQRGGK